MKIRLKTSWVQEFKMWILKLVTSFLRTTIVLHFPIASILLFCTQEGDLGSQKLDIWSWLLVSLRIHTCYLRVHSEWDILPHQPKNYPGPNISRVENPAIFVVKLKEWLLVHRTIFKDNKWWIFLHGDLPKWPSSMWQVKAIVG